MVNKEEKLEHLSGGGTGSGAGTTVVGYLTPRQTGGGKWLSVQEKGRTRNFSHVSMGLAGGF